MTGNTSLPHQTAVLGKHIRCRLQRWKEMTPKERSSTLSELALEDIFVMRQNVDPGFYRWVVAQLARTPWIRRHLRELTRFLLLDRLRSVRPTMKDLRRTAKADGKRGPGRAVHDKTLQRFVNDYYPEFFAADVEEQRPHERDRRVAPVTTLYSDYVKEQAEAYSAEVADIARGLHFPLSPRNVQRMLDLHSGLRCVEPADGVRLRDYWEDVCRICDTLVSELGEMSEEGKELVRKIKNRHAVIATLLNDVEFVVELRWFNQKSAAKKLKVLQREYPLKYSRTDAKKAIHDALDWFERPSQVVDLVSRGAAAYASIGRPEVAITLYEECYRLVPLDDIDTMLFWYNIAIAYRMEGKFKKMIGALQGSLSLAVKLDRPLDIAMAHAQLAEAYSHQGKPPQTQEHRAYAHVTLADPRVTDGQRAYGFLHMADCACRLKDDRWEFESLDASFDAAQRAGMMDYQLYASQRLTDLNAGRCGEISEDLPGRVRRPPEFRWLHRSPFEYEAIPPDDMVDRTNPRAESKSDTPRISNSIVSGPSRRRQDASGQDRLSRHLEDRGASTERTIPSPFKVFRPLFLVIPKSTKEQVRWRKDKRGVYGLELLLDDQSFIDFDFSDWITEYGTIRQLSPKEPISPVQIDDHRVGLQGIQASSIVSKWYDAAFTPKLIIDGWRRHGDLIPFDEIVSILIHRDIVLMHDYYYTCMLPSWDVSLTLPAYLHLCEDIPGFETRLLIVTELGDQIRKSLKKLNAKRGKGGIAHMNLEKLLEKLHALEDELSLALNVARSGFDVHFGERGGPDLYVNSVPCEQKSRFPTTEGKDIEVRIPEGSTIVDVYRLFVMEVKQTEKAFRKADIFFNNISRTGPGMAYTGALDSESKKGKPPFLGIARASTNLRFMIDSALALQKEWGKIIVPYTRYMGSDSRYRFPIPIPLSKYREVMGLERPDGKSRND